MFVGHLDVNFEFPRCCTYLNEPIKAAGKVLGDFHGAKSRRLFYFGLYLCFMIVLKGFAIKVATLTFADTTDKNNQYNPHDLGYGKQSLCEIITD